MSAGTMGILILVAIAVVVSLICHAFLRRFWPATNLAATAAAMLFLVASYIELGYLDPFFPIAFVFGWVYAWFVAMIVGIPFHIARKPKPPGHCPKCSYNLRGNVSGVCPECGTPTFREH